MMPYSVPAKLDPELARVRAYWEGLKRGEADMPFGDDVNLSALPDLSGRLMLIEVTGKPVRFRLGMVGDEIKMRHGGGLVGKFLDELESHRWLEYLHSQCSATVESRAPTYYRYDAGKGDPADRYSRLILPMWGNGRIGSLLGAVAWG